MQNLLTVKEASVWASEYLRKDVTASNIAYLIQYGRIGKNTKNGSIFVNQRDLEAYYARHNDVKAAEWKKKLGDDLNWTLSFAEYKEAETTKHVHRLHPYKGKFIPQLVEYFLDDHTDQFKREVFFAPGDVVLDPFCGSGTTLVQASELGINAIGIDVSAFNAFISNIKVGRFDVQDAYAQARAITRALKQFQAEHSCVAFEEELLLALKDFNCKFFPSPQFKIQVRQGEIDEKSYGAEKAEEFLAVYEDLVRRHKIVIRQEQPRGEDSFLARWYVKPVRDEIDFVFGEIQKIENQQTKKLLALVLSRTIRSCRATTHADLGTLKEPTLTTYFCKKHGKICKPLFSICNWWQRYAQDTLQRITQFHSLRSDTLQRCLIGDSRSLNPFDALREKSPKLAALAKKQKIAGIFSSPPYVGLIDYHEQHAYAYDLFGFARKDELEIGALVAGQGRAAQESYVQGIAAVLNNCKAYLRPNYHIFLVANDKNDLYPQIAAHANMEIVGRYKRPVLNRVEKNRLAYSEIIFHLRGK